MNYTEKYHLPQWEETDRIMRTDFNQMCADMEAAVNTCYSPDKRPCEYLYMSIKYAEGGGALYTFAREPVMVVLFGLYKTLALHQNSSGSIGNNPDLVKYHVVLKLDGKNLITLSKTENFGAFGCDVLILY